MDSQAVERFTFWAYPDPLVWWHLVLYYVLVFWAAFTVGCFGLGGGAVFVPGMLFLPGMEPKLAVATVFVGSWPMSISRACQLYRNGGLPLRPASFLMVGAIVGALLGQTLLPYIPGSAVSLFIAAVAIFAGVQTQLRTIKEFRLKKTAATQAAEKASLDAVVIGQGSLSATGTDSETHVAPSKSSGSEQDESASPPAVEKKRASLCGSMCMPVSMLMPTSLQPATVAKASSLRPSSSSEKASQGTPDEKAENSPHQLEEGPPDNVPQEQPTSTAGPSFRSAVSMLLVGFVAAVLSSLSGTGGPLILFPMWLIYDPAVQMRFLVGLASCFAVSMVTFSCIGALLFGQADIGVALGFAAAAVSGTLCGGMVMQRMGNSSLKLAVGIVLGLVGTVVAVKTLIDLL
eukprot:TRINITY_DN33936_c0_g1_i1.p1 TRINITY_DN33936_c0_g1~~TRINITY_DN33936_c0_g1_i1.p1  ORF type:complete len:403 (-),score=55.67 TRINITY_DN33936_c0_g1_i1:27-1235(-)